MFNSIKSTLPNFFQRLTFAIMSSATQTTSSFQGYPGECMSKVLGFEQRGDEKLGEVSVVAQGGNWTLVKSPRKVKEDRKRVKDYDEDFPVLAKTRSTKDRVEKVGEVSESELAQDKDTEEIGYKKVCVSYQNEGNEKIIDIVHGKSMVSGLDSVVLTVKRFACVVSGCVSTFSRNDVMLRHLREQHKMQRDDPNYPGNQSIVFVDEGKDGGNVGPDPKPTQGQDTMGEGGEVGAQVQDTEGVDMEVGSESEPAQNKDTEEIGYKKVCISYQNEGNEKIFDIVHGKSMVSGLDSVVLTVKRFTCVVSGCVSTFSRNDVMLRHLREQHKMQRDDPNCPGNQSIVFGDKGKDGGDVGCDSEPAQDQDNEVEGGKVVNDSEPAQEPVPSKKKKKISQIKKMFVKIPGPVLEEEGSVQGQGEGREVVGSDPEPALDDDVVFGDEGGDPEPTPRDQDTADDVEHALVYNVVIGDEGGNLEPSSQDTADDVEHSLDDDVVIFDDPEPAPQDTADNVEHALDDDVMIGDDPDSAHQDTADDVEHYRDEEVDDPEPAQVQDIADVEPALEPRRPTFISDEFKECLRIVFEDLPGKVTSQQILSKIKENEELKTYWEQFLQVNKSKAKAVDTVKQFLGGSRKVKGHLDPAIESALWALLTPDSVLTTKALVQRAAEDEQFKVVWDHFKARRPTLNKAADWVRRTYNRKKYFI